MPINSTERNPSASERHARNKKERLLLPSLSERGDLISPAATNGSQFVCTTARQQGTHKPQTTDTELHREIQYIVCLSVKIQFNDDRLQSWRWCHYHCGTDECKQPQEQCKLCRNNCPSISFLQSVQRYTQAGTDSVFQWADARRRSRVLTPLCSPRRMIIIILDINTSLRVNRPKTNSISHGCKGVV